MGEYKLHRLAIDQEFRALKHLLTKKEYRKLVSSIKENGCNEPILVWENLIIDGHYRYEICHEHGIPFQICQMEFEFREEVISWICSQQLNRGGLEEEYRIFYIGMQYEADKAVNQKRAAEGNYHYTFIKPDELTSKPKVIYPAGHKVAKCLAEVYHLSWTTVTKYGIYAKAIETIRGKVPEAAPRILSGRYKISQNNVIEMASLTAEQIRIVISRVESMNQPFVPYKHTRMEIQGIFQEEPPELLAPGPTIKEMPQYDPDAEIVSLSLTVPSWVSTINRTREKTVYPEVSSRAKQQLYSSLDMLIDCAQKMQTAIKEQ